MNAHGKVSYLLMSEDRTLVSRTAIFFFVFLLVRQWRIFSVEKEEASGVGWMMTRRDGVERYRLTQWFMR
jgi:hypothetical protein